MEKRLLLAIVLSFLVLVFYQIFFVKKPPPPEKPLEAIQKAEKKPSPETSQEIPPLPSPPAEKEAPSEEEIIPPISTEKEENILINTSLYQAIWTNRGAVLKSWKLKNYRDETEENLELVSLHAEDINAYPLSLKTDDPSFDDSINSALYSFSSSARDLEGGRKGELRFQYADAQGNRVEKIFVFQDGKYTFDIIINAWKNGQKIEPGLLWGPSFGNPTPESQKRRFGGSRGVAVLIGSKIYRLDEKKHKPERSIYNFVTWAAYEDNYFTALFLTNPQKSQAVFLKQDMEETPYFFLSFNSPQKAFLGPKDIDALSEFGYRAKNLIRFGFFGWIAQILLRAIKLIHSFIPNWGFSIIVLTIIIKILFFPLTYSSTRSIAKMQELQPKIKALRAKYKKAKQDIAIRRKMNEEMMKLYKEHGINPAGGCLPILVQIPIFWGFFRLLVVSIEFRKSPFIFWIKDLSLKDPYYVTPILMGITQFISQKMTPTSADPTQQKMMLIMPVIMTIFFMNFQSGLVLYWLTNNVLQIGQQYIMNRMMKKKKKESHGRKRRKK
ncbi:MAG: membrane protein insertase YidC [Candidatus Aminicenantales bacterium]